MQMRYVSVFDIVSTLCLDFMKSTIVILLYYHKSKNSSFSAYNVFVKFLLSRQLHRLQNLWQNIWKTAIRVIHLKDYVKGALSIFPWFNFWIGFSDRKQLVIHIFFKFRYCNQISPLFTLRINGKRNRTKNFNLILTNNNSLFIVKFISYVFFWKSLRFNAHRTFVFATSCYFMCILCCWCICNYI